jgi:conserved oligomeric Golgi complex subunit 8
MAESLHELLVPYLERLDPSAVPKPSDPATAHYLNRFTTLSLESLTTTEPQSLSQSAHSVQLSLQALSKRSHRSIITSADRLSTLSRALPDLATSTNAIHHDLPELDAAATKFSEKYSKSSDNPLLERRQKALLLAQNVDRVADVLDLPTLLSSAISASTTQQSTSQQGTPTASASATASYTSALDLHAHIKRLHSLYPNLDLVSSIASQAEEEMKGMATNLISGLQAPGVKLAGAMRTIGWLRRVAPELDESWSVLQKGSVGSTNEGALGSVFLVCRLANLITMLEALDPLRELADQETTRRLAAAARNSREGWSNGQQTERYLKRYVEIFREQSFAIISMYKSIFPAALPAPGTNSDHVQDSLALESKVASPNLRSLDKAKPSTANAPDASLTSLPSALSTFPLHLVEMLSETLKKYLPNIQDRASRDSLLTQVLYCAGSLGRLGGDFGMMLALLEDEDSEDDSDASSDDESDDEFEWVEAMKKHRIQASRLELLASGVGSGKGSGSKDRTASPDG